MCVENVVTVPNNILEQQMILWMKLQNQFLRWAKIQKISFNPVSKFAENNIPCPKPARSYIPNWYKDMPALNNGIQTDKTIKTCPPFADALGIGYIQETWDDIEIESGDIKTKSSLFDRRGKVDNSFLIPNDYTDMEFAWHPGWIPELPEGYSALITHPINRADLPFYTLSGVVEHDTYTQAMPRSNFPFLIKKDFYGIIPKGTPMYQIIPFKRDDWESLQNEFDKDAQSIITRSIVSYALGGYKKLHWKKKNFK